MLFLDPVMSSSIRCLLFQNSLKGSRSPLCTEHGLWTSTLVPPHSLWDMRIQDLLLSFPPKYNCIRSHELSHGRLVRLLPPWIAHNWPYSVLHPKALILLHRIPPYEVIALSYIHLQLATQTSVDRWWINRVLRGHVSQSANSSLREEKLGHVFVLEVLFLLLPTSQKFCSSFF